MNLYKRLKNGRKRQVADMCNNIVKKNSSNITSNRVLNMTFDEFYMTIDTYWKRIFPIHDPYDATKVAKRTSKRLLYLDIDSKIKMRDLITIYFNLFYLEDFVNKSMVQNNTINYYYAFIKDYLYRYESGLENIQIEY